MGILSANNSTEMNRVALRRGADRRIRSGHLWIFSNELQDGFQNLTPGEIVRVYDSRSLFLGIGMINPHSLIAFRLMSRENVAVNEQFIRVKIQATLDLRVRLFGDSASVYRLVYAESDGLPGLIIDRFDDVFVVQSNTAGMDRLLPQISSVLIEQFQPAAVIAANDAHVRELEGLPLERKLLHGSLSGGFRFQQDGLAFIIDPLFGQKTGFFLDQASNRRLAASFVKPGDHVLDLFCYSGGFGLYALKAGAGHVTFVDSSESALSIARENVEANGFQARAEYVKADIFEWIKKPDRQFDIVILDPPALAKARTKVPAALRAYRDLNARAMALVKPECVLVTASCSGLVQVDRWLESLREASGKAGKNLRILARGSQSPDHPVLAAMPETEYLKFAICVL